MLSRKSARRWSRSLTSSDTGANTAPALASTSSWTIAVIEIGCAPSRIARMEDTELHHVLVQAGRRAFNSRRLPGIMTPGIIGQLQTRPASTSCCLRRFDIFFSSAPRTATAKTTSQVSAKLFARKGRILGSSTREMTTFVMPLAAKAFPMEVVIFSAPTWAANAMPTNFDDEGTVRNSIAFDSVELLAVVSKVN